MYVGNIHGWICIDKMCAVQCGYLKISEAQQDKHYFFLRDQNFLYIILC